MLYGVASLGTVPLRVSVELSKASQDGVRAVIEATFDPLVVFPSSSRLVARSSKLIISPTVALIINAAFLKVSRCTPTSISKFIEAPLNPSTSDAINCIPKVWGG
jgi:hypothetical protein